MKAEGLKALLWPAFAASATNKRIKLIHQRLRENLEGIGTMIPAKR
jgi:hypothetical protein